MPKIGSILGRLYNASSFVPQIDGRSCQSDDNHRHFALQPILSADRRAVGAEVLFRSGWEDQFDGDPDSATRIMIDNWLLYGFEDLNGGFLTFLNCTREALVSGFLTLLPKWAVFEILETVEPDDEVVRAIRRLKKLGYMISLDDFESPERMSGFLDLADFIKIDFRITGPMERARLLRSLKDFRVIMIAEKVETEEEFKLAKWEGFQLFQGHHFRESATFSMPRDDRSGSNRRRILDVLSQTGFAIAKLTELIDEEPGIGYRVLRMANWSACEASPVNTVREALRLVGKSEFRKMVLLAMVADVKDLNDVDPELMRSLEFASLVGGGNSSSARNHNPRAAASRNSRGKILKMPVSRREGANILPD